MQRTRALLLANKASAHAAVSKSKSSVSHNNYWDNLYLKETSAVALIDDLPVLKSKRLSLLEAAKASSLPSNILLTTRDFIHNSLYNPYYGYFSTHAQVFQPPTPIDVTKLRNNDEFLQHLSSLYKENAEANSQLWHTPTELFNPYYGFAIGNYIAGKMKGDVETTSTCKSFTIVEIGAGNGTLMTNILQYLHTYEPTLFAKVTYKIIEISPVLSAIQRASLLKLPSSFHSKVKIVNKSIFDIDNEDGEKGVCFVIALEVLDNLSHDLVRFDSNTFVPYQGAVVVENESSFEQVYEEVHDPLLLRYLKKRQESGYVSPVLGKFQFRNPFVNANLTEPEFVPTNAFHLLELLDSHFPEHHLIFSDFHALPEAIKGIDGPVVQTRYQGEMVPCTSYLVKPGYFDIFFPTNFNLLSKMYNSIGKVKRTSRIVHHQKFLQEHSKGLLEKTTTTSGDNPMMQYYQNVSFFFGSKG